VFRDKEGNPTDHPGLRLQLRDFAYEELALRKIGDGVRELIITTQQLCEYLDVAETRVARLESLGKPSVAPGSRSENDLKHLQIKLLLVMKRGMLSRRRELQSVRRSRIKTTRVLRSRAHPSELQDLISSFGGVAYDIPRFKIAAVSYSLDQCSLTRV
jgi:hypothetical protein